MMKYKSFKFTLCEMGHSCCDKSLHIQNWKSFKKAISEQWTGGRMSEMRDRERLTRTRFLPHKLMFYSAFSFSWQKFSFPCKSCTSSIALALQSVSQSVLKLYCDDLSNLAAEPFTALHRSTPEKPLIGFPSLDSRLARLVNPDNVQKVNYASVMDLRQISNGRQKKPCKSGNGNLRSSAPRKQYSSLRMRAASL